MKEILMVPTRSRRGAFGIYCPACKTGTNETTFFSFEAMIAMHKRATGHRMVYVRLVEGGDDEP